MSCEEFFILIFWGLDRFAASGFQSAVQGLKALRGFWFKIELGARIIFVAGLGLGLAASAHGSWALGYRGVGGGFRIWFSAVVL